MTQIVHKNLLKRWQDLWGFAFNAIVCGSIILFISFGIRHGFGLFLQPITQSNGWGREVFAFALAMQNLVWGASQPFVGIIADRYGAPIVVAIGTAFYAVGLWIMSFANNEILFLFAAGGLIGLGLAGTTFPIVFGTIGRLVKPEQRTLAMGLTMALASFGQFAMLPISLTLIEFVNWHGALIILSLMCLIMLPAALGMTENTKKSMRYDVTHQSNLAQQSIVSAIKEASKHRDFWLLTLGFFACGFQVVFIAVHLPAFIADQGLPLSIATTALALIGLFNIAGTYYAGKLGNLWRKPMLLSWLYLARGIVIFIYILLPVNSITTYGMAILMGLLWLSTVPLTNGTIASIFGVKHLSMLGGFVFFSHQLGSFAGVWLGGFLYDRTGNYDAAWLVMIALGVISFLLNWPIREQAVIRPTTDNAVKA